MKILLISEFFPTGKDLKFTGGVESRTFFVAKYLAKKNDVSVICSKQPGSKKFEIISGIKVYRVGPNINYYATGKTQDFFSVLQFIISAIKIGSEMNVDIVEGNNFLTHLIAKQIGQKTRTPVIFWYPDVFIGKWIETSGILVGTVGWFLEKINLLRSANHYVAISKQTQKKLIKEGIPKEKITVIPCGVDLSEFKIKAPKQKFPTIVCVSRLVSYKRVEDLIWAFAKVKKIFPQLRLKIVGRGPQEKKLKRINKMLKITSFVSFASNLSRNDLIKTIKSSHLLCLPSQTEGFGISIVEAAAAGIPYVAADIDVIKEITQNGRGGLLFNLGNIKDLAQKIEKVLADKKLYEQKVKEGQKLIKSYQWPAIAQETELLYKSILK